MPSLPGQPEGEGGHHERDVPEDPSQDEIDRRFAELISDPDLDRLHRPSETGPAAPSETVGGPRDYAPPEEPEESFEPPEPEPLGSADPIKLLAWTGALAGPIALMLVVMLWPSAPAIVWLTLLAVTLVGWGVAIARLPRSRNDDDDGAVV